MENNVKDSINVEVIKVEMKNLKEANLQNSVQNTADHLEIKNTLHEITMRLEKMFEGKAEKTDLATLESRFWYLVVGFLMLLAGVIVNWIRVGK